MTLTPPSEASEATDAGAKVTTVIGLCIITFRRPAGLARLLKALDELQIDEGVEVSVVVVDNDPEGSARAVVEDWASRTTLTLRYDVEARRGIPMARNRAMRLALEAAPDFIAWMDDDEEPVAEWLRNVLETQRRAGADVTIGPGVPRYEAGTPLWIQQSGLLQNDRFTTGASFPYFHARTSGVLVRASVVPEGGFDERLALTGGEDRLFFTRIHRAGGTFVWDDRAVMQDYIPRSRATVGWLLRRWYRTGVTRSLTMLYLDQPGPLRRARRVAGGLGMAARGLFGVATGIFGGRVRVLRSIRTVLLGVGAAVGALGIEYHEYRVIHGG